MKCVNCGNELPEDGKFCENCGAKVERGAVQAAEPVVESVPAAAQPVIKKKANIPLVSAIATIAVVIVGVIAVFMFNSPKTVSDEKAKEMIEDVVSQIQNLDYESAEEIINQIKLKDGSQYTQTLAELEEIVKAKPKVTNVDTSAYPNVVVEFESADGKTEYKKEDFSVAHENASSAFAVSALTKDGGKYKLTYAETEHEGGKDVKGKIVFDKYKQVEFSVPFSFVSKQVTEAKLELLTSNVETYPEISLYFKVVDENGNPIENLTEKSFTIKEYLNINDYLERDVIYAAKIDGKDALNVSLAIDRSDSISDTDMGKIKNATNTFLSKLQFNSGDKAEIISFDTNVMQMCLYTNNKENLINGVNSMYPYGTTACYDAIVRAVNNASEQNGARCVIVFTDGRDNESTNTVDGVINIANSKSVPVYTIGVGPRTDVSALRRIANSTGGTYHHIDDISSMSQIYDEIYKEQKNMYHVKYISDASIAQNAGRRIVVQVSGNGYTGYCDRTYTPVTPVAVAQHSSRYEVIKADITWEDANRVCATKGGHLATIASKEEEDKIIAVAEASGVERLWIGGYTTNGQNGDAVGHWVMGEPFVYQNWYSDDEPSRFDSDNAAEFYLMLWKIDGRWSWNDQRNDLINSPFAHTYAGKMGYVIEYEN